MNRRLIFAVLALLCAGAVSAPVSYTHLLEEIERYWTR